MIRLSLSMFFMFILCFHVQAQDNWNRLLADPFGDATDTLDYKMRIAPLNTMLDLSSSYVIKEITDESDSTLVLNWESLLFQTKEKNGAFGQYAFNILQTEFLIKGLVFNAGFGSRSEAYANMDGPDVALIVGGGGFDATSNISPDIHYNSWYQFNLGAKKYFNSSFLGLNLKLVDGIEHFKYNGSYDFIANEIFNEIDITRNVVLQSTSLITYNSFNDIEFRPNRPFTDNISFENVGFLFDLYGGTRVGKHLFNVAISDIGFINWSQGPRTREYKSEGQITYEGVELSDALSSEFEFNLQDSIENIIGLELTDTKSYNSSLLTKINLRYQFDYRDDLLFGVNNFFAIDGTYGYFRIGLYGNKKLTDWLDFGLSYSFDRYSAANFGLNTHLTFDKFKLGITSQNLVALFDPYGYRVTNLNVFTEFKF